MILLDEHTKGFLGIKKRLAPAKWSASCSNSECTFHQLSPYIGKLKSTIAAELINRYTNVGDLILDPFSGSGTIPLESVLMGRRALSADISPYSKVLTTGKLTAPATVNEALKQAEKTWALSLQKPLPDLRKVPAWVRAFFHPQTLKDIMRLVEACKETNSYFVLSCLLGILHHQRPGFLSYPSSHLVPYLRDKKYPKDLYPEMYLYREVFPRLKAKIYRTYKRPPNDKKTIAAGKHVYTRVEKLAFPKQVDCMITSPPYMNMLDYSRDNRLRLWFLTGCNVKERKQEAMNNKDDFIRGMQLLASKCSEIIKPGGYAILIVGDKSRVSKKYKPHELVASIFSESASELYLEEVIEDCIPDVRRARRDCKGTKKEHVLVFRKSI